MGKGLEGGKGRERCCNYTIVSKHKQYNKHISPVQGGPCYFNSFDLTASFNGLNLKCSHREGCGFNM